MSDDEAVAEVERRREGNTSGSDPDPVNDDVENREIDAILGNPADLD